jgi:predicted ATPase/DNA-binding winged helix-turn-helix (wHTH) protein
MARESFVFGPFQLHPAQQILTRNGDPLAPGPRALAILVLLAERAPETVGHAEIMARVWPGLFVEHANIRVHISGLRKVLGEGHGIVNRPGEGYALSTPVQRCIEEPGTLPSSPAANLIGREEALAGLSGTLNRHGLVTVIGPGGIGKTSLALAVAGSMAGLLPAEIRFVDLLPLQDPSHLASHVAAALGLRLSDPDSAAELAAALHGHAALLILDNCEHVVDAAAALVESLRDGAPDLRILATSREPLRIGGEHLYRLQPLASPPPGMAERDPAAAMRFPAMRLLAGRAAVASPPFTLVEADAQAAAQLCRALDGIPLAIELAAARLGSPGLQALLDRLGEVLSTPLPDLPGGMQPAEPRHRSLTATLDWSYSLLPAQEQALLARLGIFCGEFSLDAVGVVVADQDDEPADEPRLTPATAIAGLAELIDKSLVVADLSGDQPWYRLLDTVRHYARTRLNGTPLFDRLSRRHALRVIARLAEPEAATAEKRRETDRRLLADVRGALSWTLAPSGDVGLGLSLAAAAAPFYLRLSMVGEFPRQAARVLEAMETAPAQHRVAGMRLLLTLGTATYNTDGATPAAFEAFSRALSMAEEMNDVVTKRRSLSGLWLHAIGRGHYAESFSYIAAYNACTPAGEDALQIRDRMPAMSFLQSGRMVPARRHAEQALSRTARDPCQALGNFRFEDRIASLATLARILWLQGFPDRARAVARESLDEGLKGGHGISTCFSLHFGECFVALANGEAPAARDAAELMLATARENELHYWLRFGQVYRRAAALALGEPAGDAETFLRGTPWNNGQVELIAALGLGNAAPQGFARFDHGEAFWGLPEVLRLEAVRVMQRDPVRAATLLLRAEELAQEGDALAWQLRIAMTRARLEGGGAGAAQALAALDAVLSRFTEGFGTADLLAAQHLLSAGPGLEASGLTPCGGVA